MSDKNIPIETEVKYLIKMPDIEKLCAIKGVRIKNMIQTYLNSPSGSTRRVRKIEESGNIEYIFTEKLRISHLSAFENEKKISENDYIALLEERELEKTPIEKTRYSFEYKGHIIEIDVYPFWSNVAILEIELASESEKYNIPEFIVVLKNVTEDKRYKNTNLAKNHNFPHF